jgi:competence protein ComGC
LALALLAACGKSGANAPADAGSAAGTPSLSKEQLAATLADLTQAVRKFAVEQRRTPKALDELVAQGYLERVPAAPQGKRYAIDKQLKVYLEDRK